MIYPGIYDTALEWIPEKSRVLDLGSGDGAFLERLVKEKHVEGEGVEIESEMVIRCIERGLVVHQGDLLDGLDQYEDKSFDYVLMMGTFQELMKPHLVIQEAFRVGRRVMIAYNNFSYWRIRFQLMFFGRAPVTQAMPHTWYESPNHQFCSIIDFQDMCEAFGFHQAKTAYCHSSGRIHLIPNYRAEQVLTLLEHINP